MKLKFTGANGLSEITVRGETFYKGKARDVKSPLLAEKLVALDYFEEVKPKTKAKANDKNVA